MDTEAIKSFLVGLGFGVDDASLAKFGKAIKEATLKVTALYASTKIAAAAIGYGISKISEGFEQMGYEYRLIAPAVNKALILRNELFKAYNAAGINIIRTVQASIKLNLSLTKTKFALEALYKSVGAKFFGYLTKQSDLFREKIYKNMPQIQHVLERFVFFVFKAIEVLSAFGQRLWSILTRVYDFFYKLDQATGGWSTLILAAAAAWKILNLSFLATPLGALIAGFTALVVLWDDLKTFQEGGEALINWGSNMTKTIVGLTTAVGAVVAAFYAWRVATAVWSATTAIATTVLAAFDGGIGTLLALAAIAATPIWAIVAAISALVGLLTLADAKWKIFGGTLSGFFSGIGDKVLSLLAGGPVANGVQNAAGYFTQPNVQANLQKPATNQPLANPVGSNTQNSSNTTHQTLKAETNININSTADANSVGKSVGDNQKWVNADLARNFASPTPP